MKDKQKWKDLIEKQRNCKHEHIRDRMFGDFICSDCGKGFKGSPSAGRLAIERYQKWKETREQ